jgi:hypothetical protein
MLSVVHDLNRMHPSKHGKACAFRPCRARVGVSVCTWIVGATTT